MNVLVDIGHAAHVHLFKHLIKELQSEGYKVDVVSRDKPNVIELLEAEGIKHICLSRPGRGLIGLFFELMIRTGRIIRLHLRYKYRIALGTSVSIPFLTLLFGVISINVQEDDDRVIPLHVLLAYPFSSYILNPRVLKFKFFKKKRILHDSIHEMAYLGISRFTPDLDVLRHYGLTEFNYVLVRKVALTAHHDGAVKGMNEQHLTILKEIFPDLKYIYSNEGSGGTILPEHMQDVMAFARLVVGDSQTMTAEAACLGVPSIRVNNLDKLSYLAYLEGKGLCVQVDAGDLSRFRNLLAEEKRRSFCAGERDRKRFLINAELGDFTHLMKKKVYEICEKL